MKQPKWTRKHYEATAASIAASARQGTLTPEAAGKLAAAYCAQFEADNPRFDQDNFIKACTRI